MRTRLVFTQAAIRKISLTAVRSIEAQKTLAPLDIKSWNLLLYILCKTMYTCDFYLSTIWSYNYTASPNRQACWTCFERGSDGCCWTTLGFQALSSYLAASTSCWIAMWRWPFASPTTVLGLWRFTKQNLARFWSRAWPASGKQVFWTFSLPHRPYCPLGEQMFINRPSKLSWWYEQYWVFCNTSFKITFPYLLMSEIVICIVPQDINKFLSFVLNFSILEL